jgi:hypothetical protein
MVPSRRNLIAIVEQNGISAVQSRVNDWMTLCEFLATGMFFSGDVSNLCIPSVVISQATPVISDDGAKAAAGKAK